MLRRTVFTAHASVRVYNTRFTPRVSLVYLNCTCVSFHSYMMCFSAIAMLLPGFHCTVVLISLLCLFSIKPGTAGNNGHYHKQWWKHHNKCPMGASKASKLETLLGDLFPGLFVGLSELTAVVMNTTPPADIDNATTIIDLPEPELLESTTMEAVTHMEPGQVTQEPTTPAGPGPRANYGCCEM